MNNERNCKKSRVSQLRFVRLNQVPNEALAMDGSTFHEWKNPMQQFLHEFCKNRWESSASIL